MIKNTNGQTIGFQLNWLDGSPYTGAAGTVTVRVKGDGGSETIGAGAVTAGGNGSGSYDYAPSQAETNFNFVLFTAIAPGTFGDKAKVFTRTGDAFARLGSPAGASVSDDIAVIQADTDNIQTRLGAPASDIATVVDALNTRLTAALAAKLAAHAAGVLTFAVGSGSSPSSIKLATVEGTAPSSGNDFYNGRVFVFTSGLLAGQATVITDYDGGSTTATVVALTDTPANGVIGVIV